MEKLKNKHDHALTQWLKVIIFGILLLAPFFSVLSRCLYVTCNKNAKDSYSDTDIYKVENITNNTFNSNVMYNFKYKSPSTTNTSISQFTYISITASELNISQAVYDTLNEYTLRSDNSIWFGDGTSHNKVIRSLTNNIFSNFNFIGSYVSNTFNVFNVTYVTLVNDTLDNAFEYSVNQLTQTPIFNWVQNTAIYTPVNAMTTGLGFNANNNVLALLITYWTLLTAVYIIFDIVLSIFTKITHLISGNA